MHFFVLSKVQSFSSLTLKWYRFVCYSCREVGGRYLKIESNQVCQVIFLLNLPFKLGSQQSCTNFTGRINCFFWLKSSSSCLLLFHKYRKLMLESPWNSRKQNFSRNLRLGPA